jgi:hypothetical protein
MTEQALLQQARGVLDKLVRQQDGLEQARWVVAPLFPLNAERLVALDVQESMLVDAFRARFAELQDYLGQRVFATLARIDEDEDPAHVLSSRERVQLMARKGLLDRRLWQQLRDLRNSFTHEYPDDPAEKVANLNMARSMSPELLAVAEAMAEYLRNAIEQTGA